MAQYTDIKQGISNIQHVERELNLKQLQVNRLLNITQAINNNLPAKDLFEMYNSFLSWEMGVKKMALYIKKSEHWFCTSSIGIPVDLLQLNINDKLAAYARPNSLEDVDHPLIKEFDVVVPVLHKETAIAYVFIGGFEEHEDMYNKVQFITTITNIIAVAIENKRLFKRQLEQERLNREMELASEMQKMLIPSTLPKDRHYEFASIYRPHLNVGGDYFDFVRFEDGNIAFCIADISGKGVAAALLMANFQANFHTLIQKKQPLDIFIQELNQSVLHITKGDRFITFFIAKYDLTTNTIEYINAGHAPPVIAMNGKLQLLEKGSTILGAFDALPEIEVGSVSFNTNEALILSFTDGLTDIKNEADEFLNLDIIYDLALKNSHLSVEHFNENIMDTIEDFKGEEGYPDDFTVLTCKLFK